jgi:hypothetical protein
MIIKFKIQTIHNFPAVALPDHKAKFEFNVDGTIKPWQINSDEKLVDVIPVDKYRFPITELPEVFSYALFGVSGNDMRKRLLQIYPELLRAADINKVEIAYVICKKV